MKKTRLNTAIEISFWTAVITFAVFIILHFAQQSSWQSPTIYLIPAYLIFGAIGVLATITMAVLIYVWNRRNDYWDS